MNTLKIDKVIINNDNWTATRALTFTTSLNMEIMQDLRAMTESFDECIKSLSENFIDMLKIVMESENFVTKELGKGVIMEKQIDLKSEIVINDGKPGLFYSINKKDNIYNF